MRYKHLLAETWNRHILFSIMLELTYRCNLDCFYCYNDLAATGRRLELDDYITLLQDARELGAMNLTLSGGEPLASPLFFELGRTARDMGWVIRVKTNGHAVGPETAARIKGELDPFNLDISLHGATAATHDRQTRVPGSFDRLMKNLGSIRDAGLRYQLNATMTAWNESEIEGMFEIADRLGVRLQVDSRVTPRDDGSREPLAIGATPEGIARLLTIQRRRRESVRRDIHSGEIGENGDLCEGQGPTVRQHCGAGASSVTVDPFGNVLPCVQWRKPLGNLHDQSIGDIWTSSERLGEVRRITTELKETVSRIDARADGAGFCPALAEQLEGSPMVFDSASWERLRILRDLERETSG